jgi:2-amino-4-hydroxy-6-hydroxymethyldihydropteridine diphosphokinase
MEILIGLGGNVGEVRASFERARRDLALRHQVLGVSKLYGSTPVGPDQPSFLNMALHLRTAAPLEHLLRDCQLVEAEAGRERSREERWGPRPLDLDLLIADGVVRRSSSLVLPHPRFHERAFALVPAAELRAEWRHPLVGRRLKDLAAFEILRNPDAVWVVSEAC